MKIQAKHIVGGIVVAAAVAALWVLIQRQIEGFSYSAEDRIESLEMRVDVLETQARDLYRRKVDAEWGGQ